jgi:hypothetical protein
MLWQLQQPGKVALQDRLLQVFTYTCLCNVRNALLLSHYLPTLSQIHDTASVPCYLYLRFYQTPYAYGMHNILARLNPAKQIKSIAGLCLASTTPW